MTRREDVAAVTAAVERLDVAVAALRSSYGETLGVRRLSSDVRRLTEDLGELGEPAPDTVPDRSATLEAIPDEPYDPSMWAGADDEGLGAPDRHAP